MELNRGTKSKTQKSGLDLRRKYLCQTVVLYLIQEATQNEAAKQRHNVSPLLHVHRLILLLLFVLG